MIAGISGYIPDSWCFVVVQLGNFFQFYRTFLKLHKFISNPPMAKPFQLTYLAKGERAATPLLKS